MGRMHAPDDPYIGGGRTGAEYGARCPACDWEGSPAYLPRHISQAHGDQEADDG